MNRMLLAGLACLLTTTALAQTAPAPGPAASSSAAPANAVSPPAPAASATSAPAPAKAAPAKATIVAPPPAPATDCDRLSGMPLDQDIRTPDRPGPVYQQGKTAEEISAIIAACRQAGSTYPGEKRFPFRLGLVLLNAGREKEALTAFDQAAWLGSVGGADERADLLVFGREVGNVENGLKVRRETIARIDHPEV